MPLAATSAVPSIVPSAARTVTVAPASPVPDTIVPVASSDAAGIVGAVMSGAGAVEVGESLPPASVRIALSVPPLACAGASGTVNVPSAATTVVPITVPAGSRMVTVAPASPLPLASVPVALMVNSGALGAVMSGARTGVGAERLPATSLCVTVSVSPLAWGGLIATA